MTFPFTKDFVFVHCAPILALTPLIELYWHELSHQPFL